MSASEPVMDAVEKVAAEMHRIDTGQFHRTAAELFQEAHPIDRAEMRVDARALIAAFPQLALEGREEWGVEQEGERPQRFDSKERATEVLARTSNDTDENGYQYHDHLVTRLVWTQPWSEVQS